MTRDVRTVMEEESSLAAMRAEVRRLQQVRAALRPLLPLPMQDSVRAGRIRAGVLTLRTHSNAVAAKLRQMTATLRDGLVAQGVLVEDVRVQVKAAPQTDAPETAREIAPRVLGARARAALQQWADSLPPDDGMRQAVEGLLACARSDDEQ
ncbi:MAG: DUF721 domain-containing protein [Rhodocyclaceae bacterium]|nr:DUF721 domain-containing protein [Rhodocyclaceae bacterium]